MKKMKKSVFEILFYAVERHFWAIMIISFILVFVVPFAIWLYYSKIVQCNCSVFSPDGLLSYWGSVIGSFIALIIAFIAIYQGKKSAEIEEEQHELQRLEEIKPTIHIELEKNKKCLNLKAHNLSNYSAKMIYLFDVPLFSYIKANDSKNRKVLFDENTNDSDILSVFSPAYELNEDGFPDKIELYVYDIDNNLITFIYRRCKENDSYIYEHIDTQYD